MSEPPTKRTEVAKAPELSVTIGMKPTEVVRVLGAMIEDVGADEGRACFRFESRPDLEVCFQNTGREVADWQETVAAESDPDWDVGVDHIGPLQATTGSN